MNVRGIYARERHSTHSQFTYLVGFLLNLLLNLASVNFLLVRAHNIATSTSCPRSPAHVQKRARRETQVALMINRDVDSTFAYNNYLIQQRGLWRAPVKALDLIDTPVDLVAKEGRFSPPTATSFCNVICMVHFRVFVYHRQCACVPYCNLELECVCGPLWRAGLQ